MTCSCLVSVVAFSNSDSHVAPNSIKIPNLSNLQAGEEEVRRGGLLPSRACRVGGAAGRQRPTWATAAAAAGTAASRAPAPAGAAAAAGPPLPPVTAGAVEKVPLVLAAGRRCRRAARSGRLGARKAKAAAAVGCDTAW